MKYTNTSGFGWGFYGRYVHWARTQQDPARVPATTTHAARHAKQSWNESQMTSASAVDHGLQFSSDSQISLRTDRSSTRDYFPG
jgi:hypothetical protein